jgi:hypothetical protein
VRRVRLLLLRKVVVVVVARTSLDGDPHRFPSLAHRMDREVVDFVRGIAAPMMTVKRACCAFHEVKAR